MVILFLLSLDFPIPSESPYINKLISNSSKKKKRMKMPLAQMKMASSNATDRSVLFEAKNAYDTCIDEEIDAIQKSHTMYFYFTMVYNKFLCFR